MSFFDDIKTELWILAISLAVFIAMVYFSSSSSSLNELMCTGRGCHSNSGTFSGVAILAAIFSIISIIYKWKKRK
ncbi:hypothetical protein [Colwellia sp. RSH04]|uniref:hypothetical protein n=1 Tax=Colwellia sp. RSH04 TaxID=2305464 RepID=UPI000E571995|nr:hypothetical protein [Colwellia sp. RSH04]RHW74569.1 hypothetical protein D1094_18260 [Colwellia sp. RSH04]